MKLNFITDIPGYRARNLHGKGLLVDWNGTERHRFSPQEFVRQIHTYTAGFKAMVSAGERVCIFSRYTRTELLAAEFALLNLGAVVCPLNGFLTGEDVKAAMTLLKPAFCIVPDADHLALLQNHIKGEIQTSVLEIGSIPSSHQEPVIPELTNPDQAALVILTSGTTGKIKGAVLTHRNIIFCVLSVMAVVPVDYRHTLLSFLPSSHIFERIVIYACLALRAELHFVRDHRHARLLYRKVNPHFMTAVPRTLERAFMEFKEASHAKGYFTRQIFEFALRQGSSPSPVKRRIARLIALYKLRTIFGTRLKGIVVGGAAMHIGIMKWYEAAGIKVREGYGLTECGGVVSLNRFSPGQHKAGTTGLPMPGVEVRIDSTGRESQGEILVKSPGIMLGYLDNPEGTDEAIDEDGWLHTGDIGTFEDQRFLKITGRKRVIFKNAFGEFVIPEKIEHRLDDEVAIDRSMVIGLGRAFTSALIRPNFDYLEQWCLDHGIHWTSEMYMVHNPEVAQHYQSIIDRINKSFPIHQRILGFTLVHEEWLPENGLATITLKLRRHAIEDFYRKRIENMYKV